MASVSTKDRTHRHCAYCLISISGKKIKLCGKCSRRAYCSKECQVKDWKNPLSTEATKQRGQGHKNWCGLLCGEEDIDWKVAPVEGKGLGIIALKPFPARSRILVDACQLSPGAHPATQDLAPDKEGATLQEKWELNSMGCDVSDDESAVLGLRISRGNHSCSPNASHVYCNTFKVKILLAERYIAPGEEICITYQSFKSPSKKSPMHIELCALALRNKYGIQCPPHCDCKDETLLLDVERSVKLDDAIFNLAQAGRVEQALEGVRALMNYHDGLLDSFILDKCRTLLDGFQIGIMKRTTLPQGEEYINQWVEIMGDILHPKSDKLREYVGFQNNLWSHPNYLSLE